MLVFRVIKQVGLIGDLVWILQLVCQNVFEEVGNGEWEIGELASESLKTQN